MTARKLNSIDASPDDDIIHIEDSVNDEGMQVWKFKSGKINVKVTYHNDPSPEAIKNANKEYNELFYKFNPPKNL